MVPDEALDEIVAVLVAEAERLDRESAPCALDQEPPGAVVKVVAALSDLGEGGPEP